MLRLRENALQLVTLVAWPKPMCYRQGDSEAGLIRVGKIQGTFMTALFVRRSHLAMQTEREHAVFAKQ